ncbi:MULTISPECIES: cytochrome c/FTR1 family iron permease [unclassified Methylophaga]|jgi:high-affinity iron transporter|uniref:cytochrome c/FTR1 family iron permease n=1 Tax=unclassified Methylophaga TaxID=2629249 RepID=UPI00259CA86F|nr:MULTISPECIES: cytochrome c/FTR1 family iron permease [unclassified Methylophaga]|tara:strand:+ start:1983 stop:3926 length:1944 start_codon:yes stop_codon:yes gene_type:complete
MIDTTILAGANKNVFRFDRRITTGLIISLMMLSFIHAAHANDAQSDTRQLMQIAEYIGADYSAAVANGEVINEAEYSEMTEFSELAVEKTRQLENGQHALEAALKLQQAVTNKQNPDVIHAITVDLRNILIKLSPDVSLPSELLPIQQVKQLYQQNCSACHGAMGQGDGTLAASLDPTPTNFTDKDRAMNRSVIGLYDVITNGIEGTAMVALSHLDEKQRWSLAFYAGSLAFQDHTGMATVPTAMTIQDFVSNSPQTLLNKYPTLDDDTVAQLRSHPEPLFASNDPLAMAKQQLKAAHTSYLSGDYKAAQALAVSAYLDGFELAENALDAYDPQLRKDIEKSMMAFRQLTAQSEKQDDITALLEQTNHQLSQAQDLLSADTLSDSTLFTASLVILLREGLEAMLVVLALVTVLVKTERRDAVKYVHAGWVFALIAGVATWWAAQNLISISGASREIMEGVGALMAAVILFYVGFWMHSKTNAVAWQAYINQHIHRHLSTGTLWGLAGLSFIAVYREVFETVLFYQALLTQSASSQSMSIATGFVTAVVILGLLFWLFVKYSLRLPIRTFFTFSTYLMLALSFVLIGKAVAALQEADLISISSLPVDFALSWLGIYSTWEGLSAQLVIVMLSLLILMGIRPFGNKETA